MLAHYQVLRQVGTLSDFRCLFSLHLVRLSLPVRSFFLACWHSFAPLASALIARPPFEITLGSAAGYVEHVVLYASDRSLYPLPL